jgi:diphthamide synthase (EF-2-diphthine--ammonia ligase)
MAAAVSFTGGKDSMLALHLSSGYQHHLIPSTAANLLTQPSQPPHVTLLVTFAPPDSDFKAHPIPVIKALAEALNIPHVLCEVEPPSYLDSYRQQLRRLHKEQGITHLVTGDILDVAGGFMDKAVDGTNVQLVRPLWQCPRHNVLTALQDLGIRSKISCINTAKYQVNAVLQPAGGVLQSQQQAALQSEAVAETAAAQQQQAAVGSKLQTALTPPQHCQAGAAQAQPLTALQDCSKGVAAAAGPGDMHAFDAQANLLGQELTEELVGGPLSVAEQLCGADLCGEHGEYHTLVFDAPMMSVPLQLVAAEHKTVCSGAYTHAYVVWGPL